MSFKLAPGVAATLAAIAEPNGPLPPLPPLGDIESRRSALNAMLAWGQHSALMTEQPRAWPMGPVA